MLPPRALEVLAAKRTDLSDFLDAFAVQLHREMKTRLLAATAATSRR